MAQAIPAASAGAARRSRLLFWGVVAAAGLVQAGLFAYATGPGLAGTSDSRLYLHAALTLRDSGHLLNPDGTPYRYWPPLYPVLLWACGQAAGARLLHAGCLAGSLLLWSGLGRRLLPARRALVLPPLLALSTPWLLVSKFVWSESVFGLLFAAYAVLLYQWLRAGRWPWWAALTAAGALLPLQRTLGLFLLAGVGAGGVLLAGRRLGPRRCWQLLAHLALSAAGGLLWQWYALLVAGPSRYHPSRGWAQLLSSAADFGLVLGRWLLPLPATARGLPPALWALVLVLAFGLLWPRQATARAAGSAGALSGALPAPQLAALVLRRLLWSASLMLVLLVAALTLFAQSAAGIHDAERYASVLYGPLLLLGLAAWPVRAGRALGAGGAVLWALGAALRVGHVAHDLRRLTPVQFPSGTGPGPHGQRVGAAGQ